MSEWQNAHIGSWQFQFYQRENILLRQPGTKGNSICTHPVQTPSTRPSKIQTSTSPIIIQFKPTALSKKEMWLCCCINSMLALNVPPFRMCRWGNEVLLKRDKLVQFLMMCLNICRILFDVYIKYTFVIHTEILDGIMYQCMFHTHCTIWTNCYKL